VGAPFSLAVVIDDKYAWPPVKYPEFEVHVDILGAMGEEYWRGVFRDQESWGRPEVSLVLDDGTAVVLGSMEYG